MKNNNPYTYPYKEIENNNPYIILIRKNIYYITLIRKMCFYLWGGSEANSSFCVHGLGWLPDPRGASTQGRVFSRYQKPFRV